MEQNNFEEMDSLQQELFDDEIPKRFNKLIDSLC